jgi:hypothetical protein
MWQLSCPQKTDIMKCWNRVRASLKKYFHFHLKFFQIKSHDETGSIVINALMPVWIPRLLLADLWNKATSGWSGKCYRGGVRTSGKFISALASIVSFTNRYLSFEAMTDEAWKKGERRYSFSRGDFPNPPYESDEEWRFEYAPKIDWAYQRKRLRSRFTRDEWLELLGCKNRKAMLAKPGSVKAI